MVLNHVDVMKMLCFTEQNCDSKFWVLENGRFA